VSASPDRRRVPRRVPDAGEALARVRLRAGRELNVIDVGAHGALVQGEGRLLPGTHVDVHVIGAEGRQLVRSRIVRAFVAELTGERVIYRGALAFERAIALGDGYAVPGGAPGLVDVTGTGYPAMPF
jgi:hypothetical protein